jgi:hypothetical protein
MKMIPIYTADGRSLGFRTAEAAERLVADGRVKPVYGRKGHLKAIFVPREDGGSPVQVQARPGTRYSYLQDLNGGRCWSLRRLDGRDEDGNRVNLRGAFLQVLRDCLTPGS